MSELPLPPAACIFFVRLPVPGRVKTRLAATIGGDAAARFYSACAEAAVRAASTLPGCALYIYYADSADGEGVQAWLQPIVQQPGTTFFRAQLQSPDLGARLRHAMDAVLACGHTSVLVAGSDIPDLAPSHLAAAIAVLQTSQCVFGPAEDGGCYLLGVQPPDPALPAGLFEGIQWSTSSVLEASLANARRAGLAVAPLLPVLRDIDTIEDLAAWLAEREEAGPRDAASPSLLGIARDIIAGWRRHAPAQSDSRDD